MGSPLFDLAARLGVTGASEAQAGLKGVETQAQATSAALDKVMSTADFTHSSYSELLSGQRALETSMSGQLIPAIARTTTVSFEADRAIQGMARSVLFVASTGNLAGRGMAGFIANVSRLIGPGSILLSALAIGGLAVDAFFNRFEKGEEKAEKAAKKAIDAIVNPLTEKDEEKRRLELFAKRAELEDKITTLERARSEKHAVGISDTFLTNLLSDLNQAKSDLDIVNRQIADATRIIDALSAQKAAREDAERAMADARAEIEQRAQERQTATDEGHIQQAKKALGFQQEAQALLAKAEASYRAMGVSADQIKKNIVDADAEMQRHLARGARTEAVTEAGREDRKKPEKAKQDKEDELSHLEDRIALLREGAEVQSTAAATLLKLSETEALLRAQLQETNLSLEERIRLGGNLDSVLEAEKVAQQTIRSFSVPKASEQTLAQRIKAVLTPNWVEIKQEWIQSLGDFGRTIGQGIQNVFASLAAGGPNAKHAISNLGKTVLAGLGTMISEFGGALIPFGALISAFKAAMTADPVFGGAVAIGIGAAMVALGATLGGIVNAQGSGGNPAPFSAYYGPAATTTSLYSGAGPGANPVTGLPQPSGPQQPITVHVGPVIGVNDPAAQQQIAGMVQAALRNGYRFQTPLN